MQVVCSFINIIQFLIDFLVVLLNIHCVSDSKKMDKSTVSGSFIYVFTFESLGLINET